MAYCYDEHVQITTPPQGFMQKNEYVVPKLRTYTVLMNTGCQVVMQPKTVH